MVGRDMNRSTFLSWWPIIALALMAAGCGRSTRPVTPGTGGGAGGMASGGQATGGSTASGGDVTGDAAATGGATPTIDAAADMATGGAAPGSGGIATGGAATGGTATVGVSDGSSAGDAAVDETPTGGTGGGGSHAGGTATVGVSAGGSSAGDAAVGDRAAGGDAGGTGGTGTELTFLPIPGSTFAMGSTRLSLEQPMHNVAVAAFEMTQTEVTNGQYRACVNAGVCRAPGSTAVSTECTWDQLWSSPYPVNCVTWGQAEAFCAWAGARLPSEAEWECAARSGGKDITYPWGEQQPDCTRAMIELIAGTTPSCGMSRVTGLPCARPAGSTAQGLCDMVGNVQEWVADSWHDSYAGAPSDGTAWVGAEPAGCADCRVLRGGDYRDQGGIIFPGEQTDTGPLRAAARRGSSASLDSATFGFRCAR